MLQDEEMIIFQSISTCQSRYIVEKQCSLFLASFGQISSEEDQSNSTIGY